MKTHDFAKIGFRVFGLGSFVIGSLKAVCILGIWIWHTTKSRPLENMEAMVDVYAAVQTEVDRNCLVAGGMALSEIIIGFIFFCMASRLAVVAAYELNSDEK